MTHDEFTAWLGRVGLTKAQAARALGVSPPYVTLLAQGARPITEAIADACRTIERDGVAAGSDKAPVPASLEPRLTAMPEAIADGIEHTPPAEPMAIIMPQFEPAPTKADLDDIDQRTTALERSVRALHQRVAELSAAFEGAGLPIHQQVIPMTDEEAEEAELKLLKAQLLEQMNRAAKAAPGALTDDERAEADKARRMIAKARTLAAGEPWE